MSPRDILVRAAKDRRVQIGMAFVAGAAIGSELTFLWSKERHKAVYSALAEKEIEAAKEYYANARVVQTPKPSPQEVLEGLQWEEQKEEAKEEAKKIAEPYSPTGNETVIKEGTIQSLSLDPEPNAFGGTVEEVQPSNIFEGKDPVEEDEDIWDYAVEQANRDANPEIPYIIHHDEFFENEREWEQASLTYYEGDDVLADEKDQPVPDPESTVGNDALGRFGFGSKDRNVVYVRNESIEVDFEIMRSTGKYSVEVLGLDDEDELRHSYSRPRNRKFRESDDG